MSITMNTSITDTHLPEDVKIHLPKTPLSVTALHLAHANLPLPIFHHSLRVFLLAKHILQTEKTHLHYLEQPDLDLLFTACIFHDMGAADCCNGPQRFEVEGADAACSLLHSHNIPESQIREVWMAIALHTSPGIAERISPLARVVRMAVLMDFGAPLREELGAVQYCERIEEMLPRLEVEKTLGDAVVCQAVKCPEKAPAVSWPNSLLKAHLADPEFEGVNPEFFGEEKPGRGI